jgi:hypothetical protein
VTAERPPLDATETRGILAFALAAQRSTGEQREVYVAKLG